MTEAQGIMNTAGNAKNFDRAARVIRVGSWPLTRYVGLPAPEATIRAFDSPCVIASNHRSLFDAFAGIRALDAIGQRARVLSAAWLWDIPRVARVLNAIDAIPLESGKAGLLTLEASIACLEGGSHLLVTPEGRVVPPEERPTGVGTGHKLLSKIAVGAGVSVVPGALVGTDRVWPLGHDRPIVKIWGRPTVVYGFAEPLTFEGSNHRANVDRTLAAMATLIEALEARLPS